MYGVSFNLFNMCYKTGDMTAVFSSSYTDGGGEMAAWLRKYRGLEDWIRDFDQLWEMSGQTKWQTHPSVTLLFALPDLLFFSLYQCWCSQSVTVIVWRHYNLPKLSHNAPRKFNFVSKPD